MYTSHQLMHKKNEVKMSNDVFVSVEIANVVRYMRAQDARAELKKMQDELDKLIAKTPSVSYDTLDNRGQCARVLRLQNLQSQIIALKSALGLSETSPPAMPETSPQATQNAADPARCVAADAEYCDQDGRTLYAKNQAGISHLRYADTDDVFCAGFVSRISDSAELIVSTRKVCAGQYSDSYLYETSMRKIWDYETISRSSYLPEAALHRATYKQDDILSAADVNDIETSAAIDAARAAKAQKKAKKSEAIATDINQNPFAVLQTILG